MSIEIDVLNGDASWSTAEPLMKAVWPRHVVERLPWGHIEWAHADLRVLIDAPWDSEVPGLACHAGIYFRDALWDGRKVHIGGIGGVSTRAGCPGGGYATGAPNAAIPTMRGHEAGGFSVLFFGPHNHGLYEDPGRDPFKGEVYAEQPNGKIRFEAMAPYIFDFTRKPRDGIIDLCGLPW